MLRINCPFCGTRDHPEFHYGGDATLTRPNQDNTDVATWVDYVFMRDNPKGPHREYWQHLQGCRAWMIISRDTLTHEITEVTLAQPGNVPSKPELIKVREGK